MRLHFVWTASIPTRQVGKAEVSGLPPVLMNYQAISFYCHHSREIPPRNFPATLLVFRQPTFGGNFSQRVLSSLLWPIVSPCFCAFSPPWFGRSRQLTTHHSNGNARMQGSPGSRYRRSFLGAEQEKSTGSSMRSPPSPLVRVLGPRPSVG
jgi:hypothetical protein